ncbi:MAG: MlaD family protein [Pseudanabaenaceae cyanobacterium]
MQQRWLRDGALGLLVIGGLGLLGGVMLWLRGAQLNAARFIFIVKLPDATGLDVGAAVRFRGVEVGKVQQLRSLTEGVELTVAVDNSKLAIPRRSLVESNQVGVLGSASSIDIAPQGNINGLSELDPMAKDCNNEVIVCNGSSIDGVQGVSFTALMKDFSRTMKKVDDEKLIENFNETLKAATVTAKSIQKLTDSANRLISTIEVQVEKFGNTAEAISGAADRVGSAASSAQDLIAVNKEKLAQTLDSIAAASKEAQSLIASAKPLVAADGKLAANLQKLSEDAAATAANVRQLSNELNNPNTIASFREVLDSARATFANTRKITADLDELTGDPKFRANIRNIVNGLSGLLSNAPDLNPNPVANQGTQTNSNDLANQDQEATVARNKQQRSN